MIECSLRPIPKSSFNKSPKAETKHGRYSSSVFHINGYGDTKWVVGCYLDVDYSLHLSKMTEQQFIDSCVAFLNEPPKRAKFERRRKKSLYGKLDVHSYKLKESEGNRFVELLLITDDPKNDNFWGEGVSYVGKPKRRSRKA
jgi:hypothetical protein